MLPLSENIYAKLHEFGIKQIAQRSAGYDGFDLELATKYDLMYLMCHHIHLRQLLNLQ